MKIPGFGLCLTFSWALLGPNKGRGPTDTHMGLGHENPTKELTHLVDLEGHLLSRNCVFNVF